MSSMSFKFSLMMFIIGSITRKGRETAAAVNRYFKLVSARILLHNMVWPVARVVVYQIIVVLQVKIENPERAILPVRFTEAGNVKKRRWRLRCVPASLGDVVLSRDPLTMLSRGVRETLDSDGTSSKISSPKMSVLNNENKGGTLILSKDGTLYQ